MDSRFSTGDTRHARQGAQLRYLAWSTSICVSVNQYTSRSSWVIRRFQTSNPIFFRGSGLPGRPVYGGAVLVAAGDQLGPRSGELFHQVHELFPELTETVVCLFENHPDDDWSA